MITQKQLDAIQNLYNEKYFRKKGIELIMRGHFIDRVHDDRNNPAINADEVNLFINRMIRKYGIQFDTMGLEQNVIVSSKSMNLHMPFIFKEERKKKVIVPFTIQRKKVWGNDNAKYKNDIRWAIENRLSFAQYMDSIT